MAPPFIRSAAATENASADDVESNDCGICFLPISCKAPPVFQCDAGHVLCSSCRDMLALPAGRCHVCCGKAVCRGSRRDHGRDLWPEYYEPRLLSRARRGWCRCPCEACGFVGSTGELLCHFVSAHDWPCTNGVTSGDTITVRLHDGINVVAVDCIGASDDDNRRDFAGRYLIMLQVESEAFGRLVSGFCLRPRVASFDRTSSLPARDDPRCHLSLSYTRNVRAAAGDDTLVQRYDQTTDASVPCSDVARGVPDNDSWFEAQVFRSVDLEDNEETIEVNLRAIIN
uniref:Uncharacterized protein n=1 Tax=Avena sativa TaxID=4498 RepID=A0ACD5W348_AVESA